ncbi:unnamed protein product [Vicia faba]|uniref:Uncharacterized protein n=1 Tax=Vicia faba TaxID=3906 RepID=A0AAV0Z461_VICFA|nr:unnamed protein product [Vicia faba]
MVHTLSLMASHIYPSPIAFPTTHVKECQTFSPSSLAKPDMLNFSNLLKSGTAESRVEGANISLLLDLMKLQLSAINEPHQPFSSDSSSLLYLNDKFNIKKPFLYFLQDSALTSKVTVHLDGQITFMGAEIQMKDLLSVVAESYLSKRLHKGEKLSVLVPHFSRVNISEAEVQSHSSTMKIKSTLTAPLRSPEKVKTQVAADPDTDEVYAKLRLFPLHPSDVNFDGDTVAGVNDNLVQSYRKTLTQSDANNGGFACPKNCTEIILPPLDGSDRLPSHDNLTRGIHLCL